MVLATTAMVAQQVPLGQQRKGRENEV